MPLASLYAIRDIEWDLGLDASNNVGRNVRGIIASVAITALAVGPSGATNPSFQVDSSAASAVTGLKVVAAAAAGGAALSVISSATDENLTIDAKGAGTVTINGTGTGAITLGRATTLSGALTYGGVALSNAVTGTGNMVLSASPTLSGTVAGALTFSGSLTLSSALTYGGVALSNSVTGTGSMALSASPTFTGTVNGAALTLSGVLNYGGVALSAAVTGTGNMVLSASPTFTGTISAAALTLSGVLNYGGVALSAAVTGTGNMVLSAGPTLTGTTGMASVTFTGTLTGTTANASALAIGRQGATNPAFLIDASTATSATGLKIKSAAAAAGVALSVITSGTNENFTIDAAGSGTITLGGISTGNIVVSRALNYGGVVLSNAVTGTGNMVLSATPTFTGTLNAAAVALTGDMTMTSASAGVLGPLVTYFHDSLSPIQSDDVVKFTFDGRNASAARVTYGEITSTIFATTAGAEDGYLTFKFRYNGTLRADGVLFGYRSGASLEHIFHWYDNSSPQFYLESTNPGVNGVQLVFWLDTPSPAANDFPGTIYFDGKDSTPSYQSYSYIYCNIDDTTSGSEDSKILFGNIIAGTQADKAYFGNGLVVGAPTGADKGAGSINASNVYDDNVLLTCYPWEALETGTVNLAYWDSKVANTIIAAKPRRVRPEDKRRGRPEMVQEAVLEQIIERKHGPARKFMARLGTPHDPTTIAGQRQHVKDKRHMTMYPNPEKFTEKTRPSIGSLLQCGVEADELLFMYCIENADNIAGLAARVTALEART